MSRCGQCEHSAWIYYGARDEGSKHCVACLYILDTGHPRPCKGGESCTEFSKRKRKRKGEPLMLKGSLKYIRGCDHGQDVKG